jgi:ABC-type branched-subunit amino acid transport system substrate-binding protein
LDRERPNVLVVLAGSEHSVNSALATISTAKASNPRVRLGPITVIGTSKWAAYGNSAVSLKTDLLFKLAAQFVTNYHIDRSDRDIRLFEARYLEAYGDLPSKPAFRGYDAVALFAGALFESGETFEDRIAGVNPSPLGTTYRFVRRGDTRSGDTGPGLFGGFGVFGGSDGRRHVNDQWTLVTFSNDYNISTQ